MWWLIALIAVVAVGGSVVGFAFRRSWNNQQLDGAARDALAIVDMLTVGSGETISTSSLTAIGQRTEMLSNNLARLERVESDDDTIDMLTDLRQVAIRVSAAIDAERADRVNTSGRSSQPPGRLATRAAELDLAARQLCARSVSGS